VLADLEPNEDLLNEVIEITLDGEAAEMTRYTLPAIE
jgi:hypothetical protein